MALNFILACQSNLAIRENGFSVLPLTTRKAASSDRKPVLCIYFNYLFQEKQIRFLCSLRNPGRHHWSRSSWGRASLAPIKSICRIQLGLPAINFAEGSTIVQTVQLLMLFTSPQMAKIPSLLLWLGQKCTLHSLSPLWCHKVHWCSSRVSDKNPMTCL